MIKKYWTILGKYKWSIIFCPFLVLIFVICETLQPTLMARIVDEGVMTRDITVVTRIGLMMLGVSLVGLIANFANVFISSNASVGFATDLRRKLFNKIQQLSFAEIDNFNSASLITRLTSDITRLQQVLMLSLRILLRSPMTCIVAFIYVVSIDSGMAAIIAVAVPVLGLSIYFIVRKGFPHFVKMQRKLDALNGVVRENLINIRVVKSFVREGYENRKFSASNKDLRDTSVKAANVIVTIFPIMQLVVNATLIAVLWVGGLKATEGRLQLGELVASVNYLMQILMSLMMLSMIIMNIARASASSQRILEVLDAEPSLANTAQAMSSDNAITRGNVVFEGVSFRYGGSQNDILRDIGFSVDAGRTVAVVGATGSGKSTLLQLIPRLYDTTAGTVRIDGRDVKDYKLGELHREVGMVLQKNVLFSGTIEENLRWGRQDATMPEIEDAAKAAEAHDFIMSFPDGYQTVLGRGGVNLSGGQKQRICIARSLLLQPKVLIMDDSTSAVDTETELKIREGLDKYLAGTTVFVSTQRVKTMESADLVLVLDDGRVEAFGTPEELKHSSAVYKEIYESQQLDF